MWTQKQSAKFETPNYSKEYFRKPIILKNIGEVRGKKLIEFGCGSGYWTRIFSSKGAKCTGVDNSKEQIDRALKEEKRNPLGIEYFKKDISNLNNLSSNKYDIVFIEFVLLEIPKRSKLKSIFKEAYRILKKGGTMFISDMHPFDPIVHDRFRLPRDFNYFKSGSEIVAYAKQLDGSMISFTDYHWTLEDYISSITEAGFLISGLREPKPTKQMIKKVPYLKYRENIPKDIIIKAKK